MKNNIIKERTTNQKRVVLEILEKNKKRKRHQTADQIYLLAKKKLPQISKGTVYRILSSFKSKGKMQEILNEGISHFDMDVSSHSHFICQKCHYIFDIFEEICRDCFIVKNKKTKVGKINTYKINFYGCCQRCSKKHEKTPRLLQRT